MLQFDIDVKTGIRLREVMLNDAPMIYRAIADHRDYLKTWLPFITWITDNEREFVSLCRLERNFVGFYGISFRSAERES